MGLSSVTDAAFPVPPTASQLFPTRNFFDPIQLLQVLVKIARFIQTNVI